MNDQHWEAFTGFEFWLDVQHFKAREATRANALSLYERYLAFASSRCIIPQGLQKPIPPELSKILKDLLRHILYSQDANPLILSSASNSASSAGSVAADDVLGDSKELTHSQQSPSLANSASHGVALQPCISCTLFDALLDYLGEQMHFGPRWSNKSLSCFNLSPASLQHAQPLPTQQPEPAPVTPVSIFQLPQHFHSAPKSRTGSSEVHAHTVNVGIEVALNLSPRSPTLSPRGRALSASTHARSQVARESTSPVTPLPNMPTVSTASISTSAPSTPLSQMPSTKSLPPLPALPKHDPSKQDNKLQLSPKSAALPIPGSTMGASPSNLGLTSNSARTSPLASPKLYERAGEFTSASPENKQMQPETSSSTSSLGDPSLMALSHSSPSPNSLSQMKDLNAAQFLLSMQDRMAVGGRELVNPTQHNLRVDTSLDAARSRKANTQPNTPVISPRDRGSGDSNSPPNSASASASGTPQPGQKRSGREALKALEESRTKEAIEQMRRGDKGEYVHVPPEGVTPITSLPSPSSGLLNSPPSPTSAQVHALFRREDSNSQSKQEQKEPAPTVFARRDDARMNRGDGGRNSLTFAAPPNIVREREPRNIYPSSALISSAPNLPSASSNTASSTSGSSTPPLNLKDRTSQPSGKKKMWFSSDVNTVALKDAICLIFPTGEKKTMGIKQDQLSMPIRDFVERIAAKYSLEVRDSWIVCNEKDSGLEGPLADYLGQELTVQQLSSELARELSLMDFADDDWAVGEIEAGLGMGGANVNNSGVTMAGTLSIPRIPLGSPSPPPSAVTTGPKGKQQLNLSELVSSKPHNFDSSVGMGLPANASGATNARDPAQLAASSSMMSQSLTTMASTTLLKDTKEQKKTSQQRVTSGKKSPRQKMSISNSIGLVRRGAAASQQDRDQSQAHNQQRQQLHPIRDSLVGSTQSLANTMAAKDQSNAGFGYAAQLPELQASAVSVFGGKDLTNRVAEFKRMVRVSIIGSFQHVTHLLSMLPHEEAFVFNETLYRVVAYCDSFPHSKFLIRLLLSNPGLVVFTSVDDVHKFRSFAALSRKQGRVIIDMQQLLQLLSDPSNVVPSSAGHQSLNARQHQERLATASLRDRESLVMSGSTSSLFRDSSMSFIGGSPNMSASMGVTIPSPSPPHAHLLPNSLREAGGYSPSGGSPPNKMAVSTEGLLLKSVSSTGPIRQTVVFEKGSSALERTLNVLNALDIAARESKGAQRMADLPAYYQSLLSRLVALRKARKVKFVTRGIVRQMIMESIFEPVFGGRLGGAMLGNFHASHHVFVFGDGELVYHQTKIKDTALAQSGTLKDVLLAEFAIPGLAEWEEGDVAVLDQNCLPLPNLDIPFTATNGNVIYLIQSWNSIQTITVNGLLRTGWLFPQNPAAAETSTLTLLSGPQLLQKVLKDDKDIFLLDMFPVWNFVSMVSSNSGGYSPNTLSDDMQCTARADRILEYCEAECHGIFDPYLLGSLPDLLFRALENYDLIYRDTSRKENTYIVPLLVLEQNERKILHWLPEMKTHLREKRLNRYFLVSKELPLSFFPRFFSLLYSSCEKVLTTLLDKASWFDSYSDNLMLFLKLSAQSSILVKLDFKSLITVDYAGPASDTVPFCKVVHLIRVILKNQYYGFLFPEAIDCPICKHESFALDTFIQVLAKERDALFCKKTNDRKRLDVEALAPDLVMPHVKHAPPYQIKGDSLLGEGAFGLVTSGTMKVNNELISIAVKKFKVSNTAQLGLSQVHQEFLMEAMMGDSLNSPFLLKHLSMDPYEFALLQEVANGGVLGDILHKSTSMFDSMISLRLRRKMCLDIAHGLNYLHSLDVPIIHRDIRSFNIFVLSLEKVCPVNVKIGDFGLSCWTVVPTDEPLESWQWAAPEVIQGSSYYNTSSDIYSFGVVMYEIFSRILPFTNYHRLIHQVIEEVPTATLMKSPSDPNVFKAGDSEVASNSPQLSPSTSPPTTTIRRLKSFKTIEAKKEICENGLRPLLPADFQPKFCELLRRCWDAVPENRPTAATLTLELEKMEKADFLFSWKETVTPDLTQRPVAQAHHRKPTLRPNVNTDQIIANVNSPSTQLVASPLVSAMDSAEPAASMEEIESISVKGCGHLRLSTVGYRAKENHLIKRHSARFGPLGTTAMSCSNTPLNTNTASSTAPEDPVNAPVVSKTLSLKNPPSATAQLSASKDWVEWTTKPPRASSLSRSNTGTDQTAREKATAMAAQHAPTSNNTNSIGSSPPNSALSASGVTATITRQTPPQPNRRRSASHPFAWPTNPPTGSTASSPNNSPRSIEPNRAVSETADTESYNYDDDSLSVKELQIISTHRHQFEMDGFDVNVDEAMNDEDREGSNQIGTQRSVNTNASSSTAPSAIAPKSLFPLPSATSTAPTLTRPGHRRVSQGLNSRVRVLLNSLPDEDADTSNPK